MFDRIFSAALTFCVLVGGTLAIGSELLAPGTRAPAREARQAAESQRIVATGQPAEPARVLARTKGEAAPRTQ